MRSPNPVSYKKRMVGNLPERPRACRGRMVERKTSPSGSRRASADRLAAKRETARTARIYAYPKASNLLESLMQKLIFRNRNFTKKFY